MSELPIPVCWEYRCAWANCPDAPKSAEIERLLSEGWEPFAVTYYLGHIVWLRRVTAWS